MEIAGIALWQGFALTGVGLVAGWINVMAGGGSLLSMPALLLMGLPGPVANGTNRIAIIAQNVSAVTAFRRAGLSDIRLSITLALAAVPGAIAGAMLGAQLDGPWFRRVLAAVMVIVLVLMATGGTGRFTTEHTVAPSRRRLVWGHVLMVGAGAWGGFIQIGVGFILMPILHRVIGLDLVRVNMHKVFIVLVYSIVALAVYASSVQIEWLAGAFLAVGNATGGWLGAHTTVTRGERLIRWVFNAALVVLVIRLLWPQ